ncbi:Autophagy-related protein 6 [Ascosphaera apis ARSEF 7405]|uniref:Autophagy-related protein 6 n=1 Tax=Ascosphaera apis ARSEF 7405 TaxID=392613 RepID=A0A167YYJ0_9EURO|nr:Autophagy-related protein 6 [Ascosphaera apis ARSEF 7405]
MSFVVLSESQVVSPSVIQSSNDSTTSPKSKPKGSTRKEYERDNSDLSTYARPFDQAERANRLFEIISSHSDIDHPICAECTDLLTSGFSKRLQAATKERDAYVAFLKELNSSIPSEEDVVTAQKELDTALAEEKAAFEELLALEKEKAQIDSDIAALEEEARALDIEEEKFWREKNQFSQVLSAFQDERDAVAMKFDHDTKQLERLRRANVYSDAFTISHDGPFATINGLRLGRLANAPVDWAEINAAWGQALLLLATLAERSGYKFQGYRLKPMGSRSTIEKIEYPSTNPRSSIMSAFGGTGALGLGRASSSRGQAREQEQSATQHEQEASGVQPKITTLELFATEMSTYLPLPNRKFDNAMVAFLDCLKQLGEHVEKLVPLPSTDVTGKLHWTIERDKIKDSSIRIGLKQGDETWTRACKYTLICCKVLLACVSNMSVARKRASSTSSSAASSRRPPQPT